jgi:serine/threonine protein kinase
MMPAMVKCPTCGGDHALSACPSASWDDATELGISPVALPLSAGMMVGEYRLAKPLGQGGMGVVWEAEHPLIGRKVAVKIVEETSAHVAARFLKEAQSASRLRHRNIVDVFGFGQLPDGRSYLVMELLVGETLAERLEKAGALTLQEALPIADGILTGLRVAHEQGIIHRDLKPENVWLTPPEEGARSPTVKLLDFGLAKLTGPAGASGRDSMMTRQGVPLGTPAFMSPEQCRGVAAIDHRTDLYAVGVMLFLMVSGKLPFTGESFIDVMTQHLTAEPPRLAERLGLPAALDEVIRKALAKRPEDRWATVEELREALQGWKASAWLPAAPAQAKAPASPSDATDPDAQRSAEYDSPLHKSVLLDNLTVAPSLEGGTLTLAFQGELDREDGATLLANYLLAVSDALKGSDARRVVLELDGLYFLEGAALGCLSEWLSSLRDQGLGPTVVRYSNTVGWQRSAVPSLARADPSIMLEQSDW